MLISLHVDGEDSLILFSASAELLESIAISRSPVSPIHSSQSLEGYAMLSLLMLLAVLFSSTSAASYIYALFLGSSSLLIVYAFDFSIARVTHSSLIAHV